MAAKSPTEVLALLRYSRRASQARKIMTSTMEPHWRYAYDALCNVSRSFAVVIMQLHPDLRNPVCVFYLVLRALDTVEDDTSADEELRRRICESFWTFLPKPRVSTVANGHQPTFTTCRSRLSRDAPPPTMKMDAGVKLDEKLDFNCFSASSPLPSDRSDENCRTEDAFTPWSSSQFGSGAEKELCERFEEVVTCFGELEPAYQEIIINIARRTGKGMADYIHQKSCDTIADYDMYCHYVAGLVGYGLTDIFVESKREDSRLGQRTVLSNSMGLFLQKTNIIRDYLEDIEEGRTFWPREIWCQYADNLTDLKDSANRKFALACLNHMVMDALQHVPHCLEYMSGIRSTDVFNFVAIPQVMAIATLSECYHNGRIFEGVVKVRRARTASLILNTTGMDAVYKHFFHQAHEMLSVIDPRDPNAVGTREGLKNVIEMCVPHVPAAPNLIIPNLVSIVLFCGLSSYVLKRRQDHFDGAVFTWRSAGGIMEPKDMLAVGALVLVCMYMFGFFLLPYMTKLQQDDWRRLQGEAAEVHGHTDNSTYRRDMTADTQAHIT